MFAAPIDQAYKLIIEEPNATGLNTPGTYEFASLHKFAGGKSKRNLKGKSKSKYGGKGKKYNTRKLKKNNRFTRSKRIHYNYKNKY